MKIDPAVDSFLRRMNTSRSRLILHCVCERFRTCRRNGGNLQSPFANKNVISLPTFGKIKLRENYFFNDSRNEN